MEDVVDQGGGMLGTEHHVDPGVERKWKGPSEAGTGAARGAGRAVQLELGG